MSVIGSVNLAESLVNQGSSQGQELPTARNGTSTAAASNAAGPTEDLFTPSSQNGQAQNTAQDAGLFSVAQSSFFSAAADFLLGLNNAGPAGVNALTPIAGNSGQQTTSGTTQPNAATLLQPIVNAGTQGANGTSTVNGAAAAPAAANGSSATNTNSAATAASGPLATQQQLQALNTALAALGLTPQEIQQLDQIASVINDFNPTAYAAPANQLEQLAQVQAGSAPANGAATTTSSAAANETNGNNGNGFQLQELVIKFSGVQGQGGTGTTGTGAAQGTSANGNGTLQAAAFNLQVEEVNLTLTNGQGQTAQVQVPQANASTPDVHARAAGA